MTAADSRVFGPYEIVRRLGVGGMAETFLALRRGAHGVEQRVCLKRVLPAFAADPSFLRQFEREARIASTLRHSSIVSVVEFGSVEGTQYLALELIDGVDLRDYLSARPQRSLEPTAVARIALDLGHALRHAHESGHGVVHRDVSPANVMLSRTGEVKLTDFGVARVMSSAAPTTSTGVRGKIAYMSPEQLRGDELDGRADLFGLGVVLFEALCGQRPFQGAHDVEVMRRIAAGERPPVSELAPPETPPELLVAIEGLLATERDVRTPSATVLIEQLSTVYGLHQARRSLGRSVDALRGGPETREHVTAQRDEGGDTRLGPVPAEVLGARRGSSLEPPWQHDARVHGDGNPAPPVLAQAAPRRAGPPSRLALGLALLGVAALVGALAAGPLLVGTRASSPPPRAPVAARASRPAATEAAPRALAAAPPTPTERPSPPAAPAPARAATPALLTRQGALAPPAARPAAAAPPAGPPAAPALAAVPAPAHAQPADAHPAGGPGAASPSPARGLAPASETSPGAAAAPATVAADLAASSSAGAAAGADEDAASLEARPGTLRVTVIPWGDVWVDGRYMGRAPAEVTLRPGRHTVAAGTDGPSTRRSVHIVAGQARRLELDLER